MNERKRDRSHKKRKICITALVFLAAAAVFLSGCSVVKNVTETVKEKLDFDTGYVFRVGKEKCKEDAVRTILMSYQKQYAQAYGMNLWAHEYEEGKSLEEYVKVLVFSQLSQVYTLDAIADEAEIELTEDEQELAKQAGEDFYGGLSAEEKKYLHTSKKSLTELYERYALARKLYDQLAESVESEVSDDEARVMRVKQIFVSDGQKAADLLQKIRGGEDFDTLAAVDSESESVDVNLDRTVFPEAVTEQIFALKDGEVSDVIQTDNGYYIIYCVQSYDAELTEANKPNVLEQRIHESVTAAYSQYEEETQLTRQDEKWNGVRVDTSLKPEAPSFQEIYEKHFEPEDQPAESN